MKTYADIISDINADINEANKTCICEQSFLSKLRAKGYQINYTWVKGRIGTIWNMPTKELIRIQISDPVKCGNFHKAWVIELKVESNIEW